MGRLLQGDTLLKLYPKTKEKEVKEKQDEKKKRRGEDKAERMSKRKRPPERTELRGVRIQESRKCKHADCEEHVVKAGFCKEHY